jgi:pimeloyl-ACP methyl ester carboxylesterase
VIIDAGHFVWEEAPAEYASAVIEAISGARTHERTAS